jgi:diguanylate cyclase (GGDEF)-like protein/PAS domain S-box-containing protein
MKENNAFPIKVLLIDDDEDDFVLTGYIFEEFKSAQYELDWASDYEKALQLLCSNSYDIYLVDYRLGAENGLSLMREAKAKGCIAPIILLTGQGDSETDLEAMQAGAADYLVKGEFQAPLLERSIRYSVQHSRAVENLLGSEIKFRSVFQSASDAIFLVDEDANVLLWNNAAEKIFGYTEAEIVGKPSTSLMGKKFQEKTLEIGLENTFNTVLAPMAGKIFKAVGRRKDGSEFPLELSGSLWKTNRGMFYTAIIRDITKRRAAEELLVHEATHDSLTGLPNRAQFTDILNEAIEVSETNKSYQFAVLFLDLDRFKIINDGLGHVMGDKLLVAISERLSNCIRPGDTVARFGGDEFTLLINNIVSADCAIEIAERLQEELIQPFTIDGHEVYTSASVGITFSDAAKRKAEDFLRDSDTAMYRAKATGKARYQIFDSAMNIRSMSILQTENDLRRAVEREEFFVVYQPIVNLKTGEVREFEALVRWNHPEHGFVQPNDFIPVAEETGLIMAIDRWVLNEACRQLCYWQQNSIYKDSLSISVNLSTKLLINTNLSKQIRDLTERLNLNPQCLKLEVTETSVMENAETALEILCALSDLGVRISSDDFGTGYSSLSYLHRFPFARLKIDRSFIGRMDTDEKSEEIVRTILTLADNLNLEVVAEGIENEQQFHRLRELGCDFGQGYLFSKPVEAEAAGKLLGKRFEELILSKTDNKSFPANEGSYIELLKVQ